MRFYPCLISFVLLGAVGSLAPAPAALAQVRKSDPAVMAIEDLPAAPDPQFQAPAVELADESVNPVDEQSAAGQSQNNAGAKSGQHNSAPQPTSVQDPSAAHVSGTVTNVNGDIVPGASIVLEGADPADRQTFVAGDSGAFQFDNVKPGIAYHITVEAKGFVTFKSPSVTLTPGQFLLENIKLQIHGSEVSVTVYGTQEEIATQQVTVETHQRVFGIFPNFYVTYDANPVPLTTKLKFKLAFKADTDVMTFVGVAFLATLYQAGDIPDYGQGWDAYGKRVASGYADNTTDIFIGGAILPWILHQDPRYFYQGTGTTKSRLRHAMFYPFVCKGDNGKTQPNYSSMGGDLASGAISNFYYPESNRGAGLLFQGFAISTGLRMVNGIVQEFVFRKLTPTARQKD